MLSFGCSCLLKAVLTNLLEIYKANSFDSSILKKITIFSFQVKQAQPGPHAYINYSKSDAWAIGAIAYEVLGLRNPFYCHGNQSGLDSGMYEERDLPPLPENTHPTLARVIRLLLQKDPSKVSH